MKILAYPYDCNPYQELLYSHMRARGDEIAYLNPITSSATLSLLLFIPGVIASRIRGYTVFHIHWTYAFSPSAKLWHYRPIRLLLYWHYILCLWVVKSLGYNVVWTAHNILPHEKVFLNDVAARRRLVEITDLVIAHSLETIHGLRQLGLTFKTWVVIPHGNYIGVYPNTMSREESRQSFGIHPNDFVYLYFGKIRPYKGVEDLIHAHEQLHDSASRLIIAGLCEDAKIRADIQRRTASHTIAFQEGHIPTGDLQRYFSAADVVVLPFKKVTTSGSALLALSFGKAVVVPSLGDLANIPDSVSYKYFPADKDALGEALKTVRTNPKETQEKACSALRYAQEFSWDCIAEQTQKAFRNLLEADRKLK